MILIIYDDIFYTPQLVPHKFIHHKLTLYVYSYHFGQAISLYAWMQQAGILQSTIHEAFYDQSFGISFIIHNFYEQGIQLWF